MSHFALIISQVGVKVDGVFRLSEEEPFSDNSRFEVV
jgi:hypothetical protein